MEYLKKSIDNIIGHVGNFPNPHANKDVVRNILNEVGEVACEKCDGLPSIDTLDEYCEDLHATLEQNTNSYIELTQQSIDEISEQCDRALTNQKNHEKALSHKLNTIEEAISLNGGVLETNNSRNIIVEYFNFLTPPGKIRVLGYPNQWPERIWINGKELSTISSEYAWVESGPCTVKIEFGNVTDASYMFSECGSIQEVDFSLFDTSGITDMSGMFNACWGLTSLDLSSFDTSNVANMQNMFNNCQGLTSLDLSSFDTSNVTNMYSMFYYCHGLKSLNLSSFDTSNVTDMSYMFYYCKGLTSLDLSSFDFSSITDTSYMFYYCQYIGTLIMGQRTAPTLSSYTFGSGSSCTGYYASGTKYLRVPHGSTGYTTSGSEWRDVLLSSYYCNFLLQFLQDKPAELTMILNVTDIQQETRILGDSFDISQVIFDIEIDGASIGKQSTYLFSSEGEHNVRVQFNYLTSTYELFENCTSLVSLDLSSFDTSGVTDMSRMFYGCTGLTSLDPSSFDTSNVTDMSGMFYGCSGLTSLDLSSFDTSNVTDMYGVFCDCSSLTSLDLSSFDTSNVTDMYLMFMGCSNLTSIDLSSFDVRKVTDYELMFAGCTSLTSLDLSKFNISKDVEYYYGMFAYCPQLSEIKFGMISAPNIFENVFGDYEEVYTGVNTRGNNILYVPVGAKGYDRGYWLDPLQDPSKCGFVLTEDSTIVPIS